MHRSCFLARHGQSEYGGGYSGGYVLGFSLHLPQKWHRWELHAHWMTFWWWRCSSTKDHTPPLRMVRWNQKILLPFDLKKHHCEELLQCLRHAWWLVSLRSSPQCSILLWRFSKHLVLGIVSSFKEWVQPLRERGTSLYSFICNTQSCCIWERFVSLSYVGYK